MDVLKNLVEFAECGVLVLVNHNSKKIRVFHRNYTHKKYELGDSMVTYIDVNSGGLFDDEELNYCLTLQDTICECKCELRKFVLEESTIPKKQKQYMYLE